MTSAAASRTSTSVTATGRDEGTQSLETLVTYVDVKAGGGPVRIDAADPGNCTA